MTYLTPDDWYANHGLAPGDARGPQPIFQPRPGNQMPVPIMRGYYGTPPIKRILLPGVTVSPFAVPDLMWGVNGLGDMSDADQKANVIFSKIMTNMTEDMKKQMMVRAAVMTTATITLSVAFPVVGTIVAGIIDVIAGIVAGKYANEAKQVVAEAQNTLQTMSNAYHLQTQEQDNQLIAALRPYATRLAASDAQLPPAAALSGISGLGDFWSKAKKTAQKVASAPAHDLKSLLSRAGLDSVVRTMDKIEDTGQKVLDVISGRNVLVEAREARDKAIAKARAEFERVYAEHIESLKSPEFQKNLVIQLAHEIRADAGFKAVSTSPGAASAAKGGMMAAAGVTAALVAFAALKGTH